MASDSRDMLVAWVREVSDVDILFDRPPAAHADGRGVSLYLLDVTGRVPLSPTRPDRRQLELGYLVTTWAADDGTAEQLLIDLCFAAMDQPDLDVQLDPPDVRLWQALGLPPRPSFRVSVPIRRPRTLPEARPVLKPLVVESARLAALHGVVVTPDGTSVPEARVEIQQLGRFATTDRAGVFELDGIPVADGIDLRVTARGRAVTRSIGRDEDRSFVVITVDPMEAVHG